MRNELYVQIMKAKTRARFKVVIPHPSRFTKSYRKNFAHSITPFVMSSRMFLTFFMYFLGLQDNHNCLN